MENVSKNGVLITNTTIVDSARLINRHQPERHENLDVELLRTRQLVEFCNLAECVVLNDELLGLPGILPGDTAGYLVSALKASGVYKILPAHEFTADAVSLARRLLGRIGNDRVYDWALEEREVAISDENFKNQVYSSDFESDGSKILRYPRLRFWNEDLGGKSPKTLSDYMSALQMDLNRQVSPNTSYVVHQIRNVVYWTSAEHFGISYSPDVLRVDWTRSWLSRWKSSLSRQLYSVVAKAFDSAAKEVAREEDGAVVLMPPIPALIAERARGESAKCVNAIFDLRDEFAGFRRSLTSLAEQRRNARSIAERRSINERIEALFASVAKLSGKPQPAKLSTALGYTEKLLDVVKDPLSPKAYVSLAAKGAEWLQDWWNARPAFRLLYLKSRLEALPDYWELSKMMMGTELTAKQVDHFTKYYTGVGHSENSP